MQSCQQMQGLNSIRFILFLYGYTMGPAKKGYLLASRCLYTFTFAILTARMIHIQAFFPKDSIIKVAAYFSELQVLAIHLTNLWYLKRMQKHFVNFIFYDLSATKSFKMLDLTFLTTFCLFMAMNLCFYLVFTPFGNYQSHGFKFVLSVVTYSISNGFSVAHCFFYAAGVISYYFIQLAKVDQIKMCIKYRDLSKLLKVTCEFDRMHRDFESTFSFIPFSLLVHNWFQGLVYTIGAAFNNRAGEWFDWFAPVLSIFLQLCTFAAVIFAVIVNNRLSKQINCFILQLECESVELETLQLTSRLRLLCNKPFTAWNIFELKYTFIYPYVSSLVSFSLLFLQLELRLPEKSVSGSK